ncbi:MAG: alpha/beta fold hydrolase [Coriobacteriia bacterium]|nr:alpha/beta fold hydrolase [Coriobacteriia bacterium]
MTTVKDIRFASADGKNTIAGIAWLPDGEPKAVLQIAHGMQEHISRYGEFAQYLAERGFAVVGNDHLGHGRSGAPEDLGYFGDSPSNLVVADMHQLRKLTQAQYPGVPYFMLGHSMGSFMLRKYLALSGTGLAGAIVMGTGFTPAAATNGGLMLIKRGTKRRGGHYASDFIAKLTFGKDYAPYDMTGNEPERSWLSHNVENVRAYYADPLCGFPFTLNGYQGLLEAVKFSCDPKNVQAIPSSLPIFLVSGELDPVGGAGKGVRKVHEMMQAAGIEDLELKLYPGMLHEILNEPDRAQVYEDLATWMEARIS